MGNTKAQANGPLTYLPELPTVKPLPVQLVVFADVQVNFDACPALSDGGVAVNVTEALLGLGGGGGGAGGGGGEAVAAKLSPKML